MITKEMLEIIDYLDSRDDYVIFAGFAAFLHVGVEASADIDILVAHPEDVKRIVVDFEQKGWTDMKKKSEKYDVVATLEKNETTFDVILSKNAPYYIEHKEIVDHEGKKLCVLSKEAMLLTKMLQVSSAGRTDEKTKRDRQVIGKMREDIDDEKLRNLLASLDLTFWTKGWF